jgi:TonB family protein
MKLNRFSFLFLLAALVVPQFAAAADGDVEHAVNQQFENKVLVLLHPLGDDSLRFDVDGKPAGTGTPGPWTVYGGILIKKIYVHTDKLQLEGHRMFFRFDSGQPVPFEFNLLKNRTEPPCKPLVDIEIKLDQPLDSVDRAQTILSRVFAFSKQDFLNSVPEIWRDYITGNLNFDPAKPGELLFQPATLPEESSKTSASGADAAENSAEIFKIGNGVKPPKATHMPEPSYSVAGRYEKYQGALTISVVLDKNGNVAKVRVVKPLGFGLDEQAAINVKTWRFNPATRNGDPVAVAMNIEVTFRLY